MIYRFDDFEVDSRAFELRYKGQVQHLEPRVLDLILLLCENCTRVLSKDELIERLWGGRIVSDWAISSCLKLARKSLGDDGKNQTYIRTIRGHGYRFVADVSAMRGPNAESLIRTPAPGTPEREIRQVEPCDTVAGFDLAHADARGVLASIAVLPFQNVSGDPEQDYFAAGVVEDIVASLSRMRWLSVMKRPIGLFRSNGAVDLSQAGAAFGARYVLAGGVRKAGSRVRITAELLEARTGRQLWAGKFDGAIDAVFELQDEVADRVSGMVEPSLRRAEIERSLRKPVENLDAHDCYLRALPHVAKQMPEHAMLAIPLLERALRLDPYYAAAHALIAWCHELCFARGGFDEAHRSAALLHAGMTLTSDTDDGTALAIAGFVTALLTADHDTALGAIDRALAMNPSSPTALYIGAQANALAGECDVATSLADRALWLSPSDPLAFEAHMALGESAIQADRYDEAAAYFARAARAKPNFSTAYIFQAMAMVQAGKSDRALVRLRRGFELEPDFSIRALSEHVYADPLRERFVQSARFLGLTT